MNLVIHLPNRQDRYESLTHELNLFCGAGNYQIIEAVKDTRSGFGTSASFKKAIRFAKDCGIKNVTIFEDDVKFLKGASKIWEQAKQQLPDNFQILLGGCYSWDGDKISDNLYKLRKFSCLHCSYINESAYDILLQHDPTKCNHIDIYLSQVLIEKYMCAPTIALQLEGVSDNKGIYTDYTKRYSDKILL